MSGSFSLSGFECARNVEPSGSNHEHLTADQSEIEIARAVALGVERISFVALSGDRAATEHCGRLGRQRLNQLAAKPIEAMRIALEDQPDEVVPHLGLAHARMLFLVILGHG